MKKQEIDSILVANWYLTKCKLECPLSDRVELAREYLSKKIGHLLSERSKLSQPIQLSIS